MSDYPLTDSDKKLFIFKCALELTRIQVEHMDQSTATEDIRKHLKENFRSIEEFINKNE